MAAGFAAMPQAAIYIFASAAGVDCRPPRRLLRCVERRCRMSGSSRLCDPSVGISTLGPQQGGRWSQLFCCQTGLLRDAGEHARPDFLVIVKCKHEV